jgi:peptidoglycan/xylan/chitin deacetylase (PgdA/CDA1 family)
MPLWQYEDDVVRGDTVTRVLLSERNLVPRYFRHPYTRTGPTKEARDSLVQFLARRGYTVAPFTIEASDFLFNRLYVEANTKGDQELAARLRSAYLDYNDQMLAYYESLSEKLLQRSIPQISLMHACELNADVMPEMLRRFKRRGYRFVPLDEAMTDKAYSLPDGFVGKAGISWLHRWAVGMGKPNGYQNDPDPPKFLLDLLRAK